MIIIIIITIVVLTTYFMIVSYTKKYLLNLGNKMLFLNVQN